MYNPYKVALVVDHAASARPGTPCCIEFLLRCLEITGDHPAVALKWCYVQCKNHHFWGCSWIAMEFWIWGMKNRNILCSGHKFLLHVTLPIESKQEKSIAFRMACNLAFWRSKSCTRPSLFCLSCQFRSHATLSLATLFECYPVSFIPAVYHSLSPLNNILKECAYLDMDMYLCIYIYIHMMQYLVINIQILSFTVATYHSQEAR